MATDHKKLVPPSVTCSVCGATHDLKIEIHPHPVHGIMLEASPPAEVVIPVSLRLAGRETTLFWLCVGKCERAFREAFE